MTQRISIEKHVFLDTMMYMHFRAVDEVDWPNIVGASSVVIVVPRITVQELDEHKNSHSNRKVKDRIKRFLKKLEEADDNKELPLRENVRIRYLPLFPTIEFADYGLSEKSADDMLVAAMAAYRRDFKAEVLLISDDSTPRLTANHLKMAVLSPPDSLRISDELTDEEKENKMLRQQVQKLSHSLPVLSAHFMDGKGKYIEFTLPPPLPYSEERIEKAVAELRNKHPLYSPPKEPTRTSSSSKNPFAFMEAQIAHKHAMSSAGRISQDEYERANRDIDSYISSYRKYLNSEWEWKNSRRRTVCIDIEIVNTGTAPAEDVDVLFHFPDGFRVWGEKKIPKKPVPPSEPTPPMTKLAASIGIMQRNALRLPRSGIQLNNVSPLSTFSIRKTNSYLVTDCFHRIKHGNVVNLQPLYIEFDSLEKAASFCIDYEIRPENLPEPIEGSLNVIIKRSGASNVDAEDGNRE